MEHAPRGSRPIVVICVVQVLKYCLLDPVWRLLKKNADYEKRHAEVIEFTSAQTMGRCLRADCHVAR